MAAPPLSTLNRMRSPSFTSLNWKRQDGSAAGTLTAAARDRATHREFPGPVEALDLVDPIPHVVELFVEALCLNHLARSAKQQKRIRGHVVVDLRGSAHWSAR